GMIRRAPCPSGTDVVDHGRPLSAVIRNTLANQVGNWRRSATAGPARTPAKRIPRSERAVFLSCDSHPRISGRTTPSNLQFLGPIQHHLDWRAASFLRQLRAENPPAIGSKLAAKSAADVLLDRADVAGRNAHGFGHLARNARDELR